MCDSLVFETAVVGVQSIPLVLLLWVVLGSTIASIIIDKLTLNIYRKHVQVNNITHITALIGTPPAKKSMSAIKSRNISVNR